MNPLWTRNDSSIHLFYHDPSDLGSLILIRIIPKERTQNLKCGTEHYDITVRLRPNFDL